MSSMSEGMANSDDDTDTIKMRTGFFALITARLEDAHEVAINGQSEKANVEQVDGYVDDLRSNFDEIHAQLSAIALIKNL